MYYSRDGEQKTMLCRRNIPLAAHGFADIYYDKHGSGCVVGLKTVNPEAKNIAEVLVEANGTVARTNREISVKLPSTPADPSTTKATATTGNAAQQQNERTAQNAALTDEQNKQLLQTAFYLILLTIAAKMLAATLVGLSVFAIPILFYAYQTVPSNESFDAKKELKRVLRGAHLPEDDPSKPKTWLEQTLARVQATVATEVATGLGYEVTLTSLLGFATVAFLRVPMAKVDCYWLGVFGKWRYITMRDMPENKRD